MNNTKPRDADCAAIHVCAPKPASAKHMRDRPY